MARRPLDLMAEELLWVQDRILYAAVTAVSTQLDEMPMVGLGLRFVRESAEEALVRRVEDRVVPDMEAHLVTVVDYVEALAGAEDVARVREAHEEALLETDPVWQLLAEDVDEERRATIREALLDHTHDGAVRAARFVEGVDGTYGTFEAMVAAEGDAATMVADLEAVFGFVDLLETYRDCIDASRYSSLLEHEAVHDWFLDALLEGLRLGRDEVLELCEMRLEEGEAVEKEWAVLDPAESAAVSDAV